CHDEQDIRRMGGLKKFMPVTFATYAIGMLALAGFPLVFSGFWSKDAILHSAHSLPWSQIPFYLGVAGAFLPGFYMTRQVALVFFGKNRAATDADNATNEHPLPEPHESPLVMTGPLMILAVCAIGLSAIGTPAWPWFQSFLGGHSGETGFTGDVISLMVLSSVIVFIGLGVGWWLYGRKPIESSETPD